MRRSIRLSLVAAALGIAVGCSFVKSFDGYSDCAPKRWPDRPRVSSGGNNELFGATRSMSPVAAGGGTIGFDLDGFCTCPGKSSCVNHHPAPDGLCDKTASGVDNQGANFLSAFRLTDANLGESIQRGLMGIAVNVSKYNGRADDPDVVATIYNVVGVGGRTDGSATARFDGNDTVITNEQTGYADINAYVAGGVLVGTFATFDLRLVNQQQGVSVTSVVTMKSVHLVGKMEAGPSSLTMRDAVLVGRIPLATMFSRAAAASSCSDAGVFEGLLPTVCGQLDLAADEKDDGRDQACDALSIGLRMEIVPVFFAPDAVAVPTDPPCPPLDGGCN